MVGPEKALTIEKLNKNRNKYNLYRNVINQTVMNRFTITGKYNITILCCYFSKIVRLAAVSCVQTTVIIIIITVLERSCCLCARKCTRITIVK